MRYYCFRCEKGFTPDEVRCDVKDWTRTCPKCRQLVKSCCTLMKVRVIPPECDCDSCGLRFKCFTDSLHKWTD